MQPWHRWREPLAVALLVALASMLAVQVAQVALWWQAGDVDGVLAGPADDLLLLATAAAVLWCTTPVADRAGVDPAPSRHAWPVVVAGLVVTVLAVLGWSALTLGNALLGLQTPRTTIGVVLVLTELLLRLFVPAVAIVALGMAARRVRLPRTRPSTSAASSEPRSGLPQQTATPSPPGLPERLPAAWQADEAAGAVWLTADDAAQGRPGLSWPAPVPPAPDSGPDAGETTGSWTAVPSDPAPASEDDDLH